MRLSINFRGLSAGIAYLILGFLGTTLSVNAQTYDLRIANKTTGYVIGDVQYTSAACKEVSYRIDPGQTWSNNQRGSCLVRAISALVMSTPSGNAQRNSAMSFVSPVSPGSTASDFEVTGSGGSFRVAVPTQGAIQAPVTAPAPASVSPSASTGYAFRIVNNAAFVMAGSVEYTSCPKVGFSVSAGRTHAIADRGQCLIKEIKVWGFLSSDLTSRVDATSYLAAGTKLSDFEIVQSGDNFKGYAFRVLALPDPTAPPAATAGNLRIVNNTTFVVSGQVKYAACKSDVFNIAPGGAVFLKRGLCLITSIGASFQGTAAVPRVPPVAPYSSSGTGYSDFTIIAAGDTNTYRIWSAAELGKLPSPAVRWDPVAAGQIPPATALKGGRQLFGGRNDSAGNPFYDLLPVCRGELNGVSAIGNAAPFYTHAGGWSFGELRCFVFLNNKEQELAAYEVLIADPQVTNQNPYAVQWVTVENGAIPNHALNAAESGPVLHACRAQHVDGGTWVRVGTVTQAGCSFPYGGQLRLAANYEVLVVDRTASKLLAKDANEPRLASEPDRPADVSRAGEDCSRINAACQSRIDAISAMGVYKINSLLWPMNNGNHKLYKKTQGGIWIESSNWGTRAYAEVERNDTQIILYSGAWDFGGQRGNAPAETIAFGINDGMVNGSRSNYIARASMAEPDTALALTMKPLNPAQTRTFWKGNSQPPVLVKGQDGNFGNYKVANSGDGWLELYTVVGPRPGDAKWNVQFLKIDFWRNRVWELLGALDRQPAIQDAGGLRTLARSAAPSNAWTEAYALTNASVFSGVNIGAALGRMANNQQVGWTLREEVGGSTLRWEELKLDSAARRYAGVAGDAPVGRLLTETGRTTYSLTLSGSELGNPLVIDWVAGTVIAGGKKVADFLTGDAEYVGQRKKLPRPTPPGVSPGFQFVNKTDWPVMVKVSQVGCLYHGVVSPNTTMTRNTGAVWFSLSAAWSGDGKDLTKEQVFTDCVAPVALTTLGVIATAASGGSAAGVIALGAAAAGTAGAATTAVEFMKAGGASQGEQDLTAAGIYVVASAVTGGAGAFQVVTAKVAAGTAAGVTRSALAAAAARGAAKEALVTIKDEAINFAAFAAANYQVPTEQDLSVLQSWFDPEINLAGQYAGYPWPWKMKDRVMPQYEITGGPRIDTLKDGSKLIRKGSPFSFRRVN